VPCFANPQRQFLPDAAGIFPAARFSPLASGRSLLAKKPQIFPFFAPHYMQHASISKQLKHKKLAATGKPG
jgi:hypothetical protein